MLSLINQFPHPYLSIAVILILCILPAIASFLLCKYASRHEMFSRTYLASPRSGLTSSFSLADWLAEFIPQYCCSLYIALLFAFVLSLMLSNTESGHNYFKNPSSQYIDILGNIPSTVFDAMLGIIGMLSICIAIKRTYRSFISTHDIFSASKLGDSVFKMVIYYLTYALFQGIVFWREACLTISIENHALSFLLQGFSVFYLLLSIFHILLLLYKIIKLLLSESPQLLKNLYLSAHNNIRKPLEDLNHQNFNSIDACFNYLCTPFYHTDSHHNFLDKNQIYSIFILDEYANLPKTIRKYSFLSTCLSLSLIDSLLSFLIHALLRTPFWFALTGTAICILLNTMVIAIVYRRGEDFRKLYTRAALGTWCFHTCANQYFSLYRRYIFMKNRSSSGHKCIRQIYSLVSAFRDTLEASDEIAKHCLNQIAKHVKATQCGYLTLATCSHLYCLRYPEQREYVLHLIRQTVCLTNLNTETIAHNASQLINELLRNGKTNDCTYLFNAPTEKASNILYRKGYACTQKGYRADIKIKTVNTLNKNSYSL